MAHESPKPWTRILPAVLLGVCSAVKELLGRSAAERIYGTTPKLPGDLTEQYTVDAPTDLNNYSEKPRVAMSGLPFAHCAIQHRKRFSNIGTQSMLTYMYSCDELQ